MSLTPEEHTWLEQAKEDAADAALSASNALSTVSEPASTTKLGVVKIDGTSITITDGVISSVSTAPAWGSITGTLSNQTDLNTALTGKLTAASNLSDIGNASTARTNLGLGSLATKSSLTASDIPSLDASKVTSGTFDIARIPAAAMERCVVVATEAAKLALTSDDVQLGDTVKVTATKKMYMVKDVASLGTEAAFEEYITTADWSTVTNKPTTIAGYGITDAKIASGVITLGSNTITPLTSHQDISGKQDKTTAVTHTASTAAGSATQPVYVNASGVATACTYSLNKTVPSDAVFTDTVYTHPTATAYSSGLYKVTVNGTGHVTAATAVAKADITGLGIPGSDTTYSAGTGLSLSGTTFNHSNSVTAGTAGTSSATSGSTLAVPYVTYNATGHITAVGTHTHTVTGFAASSHTHSYLPLSGGTLTGALSGTTATFSGLVKGSSFQSTSDERLKQDIERYNGNTDLSALVPKTFAFKNNPEEKLLGLIAQEVKEVVPMAVKEDREGYLAIDYNALVACLIKEVADLKKEIKELKESK